MNNKIKNNMGNTLKGTRKMNNKISLIKGMNKNSDVSCEQEVYLKIKDQISPLKNIFNKSPVSYTETSDCCFKCGSFDQIAELVNNANARKSTSSGSDIEALAVSRNSSYSTALMNSIDSSISSCLISNSCSESLDLNRQSFLCFPNSDFMNLGAINSALIEENKYAEIDLGFIIENKELLSNTNIILVYSYFLLSSGDIELSNSSLFFGDISESNLLNLPFLAFLPSSTDHLINSCSSGELNLSSNSCLLDNSCLINSEKLSQTNFDNLDLSSLSNENVIDAIYILPFDFNSASFSSSSTFLIMVLRATSAGLISGNDFLNLASNSSGTDTVILGILDSPSIYFNTSNYFNVFKSFDLQIIAFIPEIQNDGNCFLNIKLDLLKK